MGKKYRDKLVAQTVKKDGTKENIYVKEEYDDSAPEAVAAPAHAEHAQPHHVPAAPKPAAPAPQAAPAVQEHKVDFDGWYGARQSRIPAQHHKEIIKADFKGRKVPVMATMAEFDNALKLYGVTLA